MYVCIVSLQGGVDEALQRPGHALRFVEEGFQELLACRHLLKGSFPFAFFAFEMAPAAAKVT